MAARMLLIGGTSHAGKSTLAGHVAARAGWRCVSTDSLARHPGRPWRDAPDLLPPHVVEHYRDLELAALMQSVLRHYESMWEPHVLPLIEGEAGLVLEGSALLPGKIAPILSREVKAVWLIASDELIERRIKAESDYGSRQSDGRFLIDKFVSRAVAFNQFIAGEAGRLKLERIDIDHDTESEALSLRLSEMLHVLQ